MPFSYARQLFSRRTYLRPPIPYTHCIHPSEVQRKGIAPALERRHGMCDWDHGRSVWGHNGSVDVRLVVK